jgi:hypothetical protein
MLQIFEGDLGVLREFVFEGQGEQRPVDGAFERDPHFDYTDLDVGWGYGTRDEEVVTESLDLTALESPRAVVESRREGRPGR